MKLTPPLLVAAVALNHTKYKFGTTVNHATEHQTPIDLSSVPIEGAAITTPQTQHPKRPR